MTAIVCGVTDIKRKAIVCNLNRITKPKNKKIKIFWKEKFHAELSENN